MSELLFPRIQSIDSNYSLPASIGLFSEVLFSSQKRSELRRNHVVNGAKNILKLIPEEIQTYLFKLNNLVNSKSLEGQLDFFRTAMSLGESYSSSNIAVWAKDLLEKEREMDFSTSEDAFENYSRIKKQFSKVNILEDKIKGFKDSSNLSLAKNFSELEKNLISYGGLGIVISDLKFRSFLLDKPITLSCSISKNYLPHTDPSWNNRRYREGGDSDSNQHNYLCNLFEGGCAIAASKNSFYASNHVKIDGSKKSLIEKLFEKIFIESHLKRRQPKTSASEKYLSKVDNAMRECFLDDKIINGAFILSLSCDYDSF